MLPRPSTTFVGREVELARASDLLAGTRLLTLTGPGGCGKTRLGIELARRASGGFADGAHFVALAAVRDAELVPVSIAGGLGLQDARGTALLDHLVANLARRQLLLVLDNMEQVLDAADVVGSLLGATDGLRLIVTSRAPLHLSWEQEFPVPALRESVELFAARAAASAPGFTVTPGNAATLDGIVARLDGLPLAIELAASRLKLLSPEAILERLSDSLSLLVAASRDVPDRQRTLRATIAWGHDLLSEPARGLLAVCSVFRGGVDLALLEQVCVALHVDAPVLDTLAELVDHSLLRRTDAGTAARFAVLETVREFAAQLMDERTASAVRSAHADVMWRLVQDLRRAPSIPGLSVLDVLDREHDNLRAALDHCTAVDPHVALRIANRLTGFWSIRGHFGEGRQRLASLRRHVAETDPEYADAMSGEAWLATDQGDRDVALPLLDDVIERARAAGDAVREAEALLSRGRARLVIGDPAGGSADVEAAVALQEAARPEAARPEAGADGAGLAAALWLGGAVAQMRGEVELASERFERSMTLGTAAHEPVIATRARYLLGSVRLDRGDTAGAASALALAVPAVVELGDRFGTPIALSLLAGLAALRGRPRTALRLAGAAAGSEEVNQTNRPHYVRAQLDRWLAPAIGRLGRPVSARLQAEGRGMPIPDLLAAGLDPRPEDDWREGGAPALTAREQEIAALVASGMTNREIADRLVLSVRTVETHVGRVLTKLGLDTRTRLAGWMRQRGLI